MSLQEEELVSSHAEQPEQASSLLDQIMAQTRIQPGSEGYDVARQGVTAFTGADNAAGKLTFNIDGLARAIAPLRDACHWAGE